MKRINLRVIAVISNGLQKMTEKCKKIGKDSVRDIGKCKEKKLNVSTAILENLNNDNIHSCNEKMIKEKIENVDTTYNSDTQINQTTTKKLTESNRGLKVYSRKAQRQTSILKNVSGADTLSVHGLMRDEINVQNVNALTCALHCKSKRNTSDTAGSSFAENNVNVLSKQNDFTSTEKDVNSCNKKSINGGDVCFISFKNVFKDKSLNERNSKNLLRESDAAVKSVEQNQLSVKKKEDEKKESGIEKERKEHCTLGNKIKVDKIEDVVKSVKDCDKLPNGSKYFMNNCTQVLVDGEIEKKRDNGTVEEIQRPTNKRKGSKKKSDLENSVKVENVVKNIINVPGISDLEKVTNNESTTSSKVQENNSICVESNVSDVEGNKIPEEDRVQVQLPVKMKKGRKRKSELISEDPLSFHSPGDNEFDNIYVESKKGRRRKQIDYNVLNDSTLEEDIPKCKKQKVAKKANEMKTESTFEETEVER